MQFIIGLGHIHSQIIQPVLPNQIAFIAQAIFVIVVQAVESHQVAFGSSHIIKEALSGIDQRFIVRHILRIVQQIDEDVFFQRRIRTCAV